MTSSAASLYADFRNTKYFPSLNGIRAICALMVVKVHVSWLIDGEPQMIAWGFLGVDMFFVISGFLITTLLLRERDATGHISLKQFYIRRTLRIFPIYYMLIGVLFVLAMVSYAHSTKTWDLYKAAFPVFLLYLQDLVPVQMGMLFHTWSLAMEEQFYLIWPSVERFLRRAWIVPLLIVLLVLNQLCNFGVYEHLILSIYGPAGLLRPIFFITFTPILLGVLAAHAMHEPRVGLAVTRVLGNRWMPALLLSLAMLACQLSTGLRGITYPTVHVLFCLALVAMVVNPRSVFSRVLQSRVMSYLGSISYGIYLYHTFMLWIVEKACQSLHFAPTPMQLFLLVGSGAVAVAALSFRFIETPIMRRRHHPAPVAGIAAAGSRQGA